MLIAESKRAIAQLTNEVMVKYQYPGGVGRFVVSLSRIGKTLDSPSWVLTEDGSRARQLGQDVELRYDPESPMLSLAWKTLRPVLTDRMRRGATIILDVTPEGDSTISAADVRRLRGVLADADAWQYDVEWLQADADSQHVETTAGEWAARGVEDMSTVTTVSEAASTVLVPVRDWDAVDHSQYREVRVWGDIQGCGDAFRESIRGVGDDPTVLKVFSGDLFDRGHGAAVVFDWMMDHLHDPSVVWVRGNHDGLLRIYGDNGLTGFVPMATRDTVQQILDGSLWVGQQVEAMLREQEACGRTITGDSSRLRPRAMRRGARKLYAEMVDLLAFRWAGQLWIVTHAGLHPGQLTSSMRGVGSDGFSYDARPDASSPEFPGEIALGWESQQFFNHGTGRAFDKGDYDVDIDALIDGVECQADEWGMQTVDQLHGHRNQHDVAADAHQHVWNLEHNVERGGTMRVAVVSRDGSVTVDEYVDAAAVADPAQERRSAHKRK